MTFSGRDGFLRLGTYIGIPNGHEWYIGGSVRWGHTLVDPGFQGGKETGAKASSSLIPYIFRSQNYTGDESTQDEYSTAGPSNRRLFLKTLSREGVGGSVP